MKKLTTLLMALMLMSTALWADETITVSANSSDISEGLDLKVVAKLFAEAKNLEEFETMLNNPDSAFCNLDLNGDGQVDYLRVVETGEGNKRLIVLQAILAKDIYQDVASIYVEKDEQENVSVQVIGDEYVYGVNYIIEPVYVYRPVIYDWFWGPHWYAWHSPWYWGYWPGWWYAHSCWAHEWYWRHCYAFHHHHHYCSFRHSHTAHRGYHELHGSVARREYATAHPERSFTSRNSGMTNARDFRRVGTTTQAERYSGGVSAAHRGESTTRSASSSLEHRTFGSTNTVASRTSGFNVERKGEGTRSTSSTRSVGTVTRSTGSSTRGSSSTFSGTTRSSGSTRSTSSVGTVTRSTGSTTRGSSGTVRSTGTTRSSGTVRSTGTTRSTTSVGTTTRSTGSTTRSSGSTFSGSTTRSSGSSSTRSSGSTFSGSSRGGGSTFSGGTRSGGSSGGGSRGGGGTIRR